MPDRAASPILMSIVVGVVVAGVIMSGLGIWLVYLIYGDSVSKRAGNPIQANAQ